MSDPNLADDLRALVDHWEGLAALLESQGCTDDAEWCRLHARELRALLAKREGACRCEFKTCDQQTVHRRDCPRYDGPVHTQ